MTKGNIVGVRDLRISLFSEAFLPKLKDLDVVDDLLDPMYTMLNIRLTIHDQIGGNYAKRQFGTN